MLRRSFCCVLILFLPIAARPQQYVVDTLAASPNIASPARLTFSPNNSGKFFFTEKNNGRVRVVERGVLLQNPFVTVPVASSGEQGLLGVAFHPEYPDSPFVYIYYTRAADGANVIARYRDSAGVGIRPYVVFIVPRLTEATSNNGGNIRFGADGKMYASVGDNGVPSNSQDTSVANPRGKIHRLNPDGSIPIDNPWPGKSFWSIGHRNGSDFTFDHLTGIMYSTERGPGCTDEVNQVPRGSNLGWPIDFNQSTCAYLDNPACVPPLYYFRGLALPALTGIVVYRASAFPQLRGKILLTGSNTPTIWTLALAQDGDSLASDSLATFYMSNAGLADVEAGPDGFLYLAVGVYGGSKILRLRPVAPSFRSEPPGLATQGILYTYTPSFNGTPPALSLTDGPEGMSVDSSSRTLRWTPTNQQALQRSHPVLVQAVNGAGSVYQQFSIVVANVNDPPEEFGLLSPPKDTTLHFVGSDPTVHFVWQESTDPDLDTVQYVLETDTVSTFHSTARRDTLLKKTSSITMVFPRRNAIYYWRVNATDGRLSATSTESRRVIVIFTAPVDEEKMPESEYGLEQNFPNPFNPTTSIVYKLPKNGPVRLAVFNLLGQEVALIFDGIQNAGMHEVEFKNRELPSGIYFYRINAQDFNETKKLTILR